MIETSFAGLELRNPVIAASSGQTDSTDKIIALEKAGIGAVVLKSLFEEQLDAQSEQLLGSSDYPEARDFLQNTVRAHEIEKYLTLVKEARRAVSVPVIASINCYDSGEWVKFASELENAGASALELNIQKIDTSAEYTPGATEQLHVEILQQIKKVVHLPVIVKISRNLSNLVSVVDQLKSAGAAAVVLFNRPWQPDIDIHTLRMVAADPFTSATDLSDTLRWIGIVSGSVNLPIAASTGVHKPEDLIKAILVGASAVELCTTLYRNGNKIIGEMLNSLTRWLEKQNFSSVAEARGQLNYRRIADPAGYERLQFIRQTREICKS